MSADLKPLHPVVDGRVLGGVWHGDRPLKVARDKWKPGLGIYVMCRSCGDVVARNLPGMSAAVDLGGWHLEDVDHSAEAVRAGAR